MNPGSGPRAGAGAGGGSRTSRVRSSSSSNNPYSGYEPGYELELHSSTYYRPRGPNTGGVGHSASSTSSAAMMMAAASREAGLDVSGYAAAYGGGGGGGSRVGSSSPRPWLRQNLNSSREGGGMLGAGAGAGVVRSSSMGGGGGSGGPLRSSFSAALGPVHSEFAISSSTAAAAELAGVGGRKQQPGTIAAPLASEAPLDDLLQHVNHLIKEFDRMYDH